jgi:hypothetical protein
MTPRTVLTLKRAFHNVPSPSVARGNNNVQLLNPPIHLQHKPTTAHTHKMSTPQIRKKKLKVRLGLPIGTAPTPTTSVFDPFPQPTPAAPAPPTEPSIFDFTFEDYKAANLNINEQHDLIGKIREEVALIDRDEIDGLILEDMAKQLQMCVFATCKMMHVDPVAVKRMLDGEFRKAYGVEVEQEVAMKEEMGVSKEEEKKINAKGEEDGGDRQEASAKEKDSYIATGSRGGESAPPVEPPSKKIKRAQPSVVQKEVKAYEAKRKRGHKKVLVLTLRSKSVAEKWESLCSGV